MELIINNSENYFDPTPKLKSSPVPISFIPFNRYEDKCSYCETKYSETLLFHQKYCKICLLSYIKNITDKEICLDVYISTNSRCNKHEATRNTNFCTRNIQEWCEYCSEILCFKQVIPYSYSLFYERKTIDIQKIIDSGNRENCKLCGKLIQQIQISNSLIEFIEFRLCSSCYQISSGWVESTLTKKPISILYLPWWDNYSRCSGCKQDLKFISYRQKWCSYCYIIVTECRYCLTTNIIFGITDQSQCKKCKKIQTIPTVDMDMDIDIDIDIPKIISDVDECISTKFNNINNIINHHQIADYMNNVDKNYNIIAEVSSSTTKWVPYSQITNLQKIAEGGFGIIYKATTYTNGTVAVKKILNSRDISKCFLNELKSLYQCYNTGYIIKCYGITQDPETKEFMLIMDYANGGDLHNYLRKNFINVTWKEKLYILWKISEGLNVIHKKNFIHRDFHSGNILNQQNPDRWLIADLGLSQPANNTSLNNEIYGVIPYIAPEIFKGATFSKESDIYGMGMIMWELTTGCKPFANVDHTILIYKILDGERPEITSDTPECFANLMKRCWDSDPSKRPSMAVIIKIVRDLYFSYYHSYCPMNTNIVELNQAEKKRLELIQSMKLGPEFNEKPHSGAIYTSRALSSLISKSTNSSSIISFDVKQEYITKEHDLDINSIQSSCLPNVNCTIQNSLNIQRSYAINTSRPIISLISKSSSINSSSMALFNVKQDNEFEKLNKHSNNNQEYISKEYELDINNVQSSSSNINFTIQNSSNVQHPNSIYTSRPLSALISAVNSSRKQRIRN